MNDLVKAAQAIETFQGKSLTQTIAVIEQSLIDSGGTANPIVSPDQSKELLEAALLMKSIAGEINVIIHAVGIMLTLPHILRKDEVIQSLSLGAGNTGKSFDLETNQQIAEFKFINWRGGSESIRQNGLFKDFFYLAEHDTPKRRCLYLTELTIPTKFLKSNRALASITSKNATLRHTFFSKYPQFERVHEYYFYKKDSVELINLSQYLPNLSQIAFTS